MDGQASRRFRDDVHDVLTAAGWWPGRDVSAGGRVIPHHYTEFGADIGVPVFPGRNR
jgi:hypothetical protein